MSDSVRPSLFPKRAFSTFAPVRSVSSRSAPVRLAPLRSASLRLVSSRSAPLRSAPLRSVSSSFMALLVIPELKLSDRGLFSSQEFGLVSVSVD